MASKKHLPLVLVLAALLILAAAFLILRPWSPALPALEEALSALAPVPASDAGGIDSEISAAAASCFSAQIDAAPEQHFRSASASVSLTCLDLEALTRDLGPELQAFAVQRAASASRRSELYAEDGSFLPEVLEQLYAQALEARLSHAEDYCRTLCVPVGMHYRGGVWELDDPEALRSAASLPDVHLPGFEAAVSGLEAVPLSYRLPDWTSPGPIPDAALFRSTRDAQEIVDLLAGETARRLLNGQATDFSPERAQELERDIYYYLDESILCLVWQELEHGAVATISEVVVADASQFRRRITSETTNHSLWKYPTALAQEANAVVASSGDLYQNRSASGITVYDGRVLQGDPHWGQSCLITDTGELLFVYEDQFSSLTEAQRFCDQNHVMFSLCFGPVIIDGGKNVTPYTYPFGEIRDTFARCALGELGERHYLLMTINAEKPSHVVYVTLMQAAESMLAHGCRKAYTLDGGQTASIVFNGRLINPVQFGWERTMSDIIYFATALPPEA